MAKSKTQTVTQGDWELVWGNYIAALRSGSATRVAAAKAEMEAVKAAIG
jgi:hypothetical protein